MAMRCQVLHIERCHVRRSNGQVCRADVDFAAHVHRHAPPLLLWHTHALKEGGQGWTIDRLQCCVGADRDEGCHSGVPAPPALDPGLCSESRQHKLRANLQPDEVFNRCVVALVGEYGTVCRRASFNLCSQGMSGAGQASSVSPCGSSKRMVKEKEISGGERTLEQDAEGGLDHQQNLQTGVGMP
jgi:hypothetical protein